MIPINLSFYVRIELLSLDYNDQPRRHTQGGHWETPNTPGGIRDGQGPNLLLHWQGGWITIVPSNNRIRATDLDRYVYCVATTFTQYPDTPHLLAVPFDARFGQ